MEKRNWKKYAFEFLSIFIAVISAFALSNWSDNRRDSKAETKILAEILNGLNKDMDDVKLNVHGHELGLKACEYWRKIFTNEETNLDSLAGYYSILTRDFVSIQNTSGYETLKSKGLELIKNDTLRSKIISIYEYDYKTLTKLEEDYEEGQFQKSYFKEINQFIAPQFQYDTNGQIVGLKLPINITNEERNILLSYLWKIRMNRKFVLQFYDDVQLKINYLREEIAKELKV